MNARPEETLVVDSCSDANGHHTIRIADGTPHGRTDREPIATVYDFGDAERLVSCWNGSRPDDNREMMRAPGVRETLERAGIQLKETPEMRLAQAASLLGGVEVGYFRQSDLVEFRALLDRISS